ncbi:hypothetical protein HMPREF9211_0615 [Lactobacillus iners LactinV 01V1-a]|uniref:Uncharacterized protein n=1 Tax=Lactobacillus iners LactinV 01V1-a TaxID=879297 RepID=E1NUU6_9LACO|nr:hypothetical protein HMPREF9211_0615 [Lactobacillus iners LactinV 01V1-a]
MLVFLGINPLWGMLLFTLLGSLCVGELSLRSEQKESAISAISALFIGLGVLFLAISHANSRYATDILFWLDYWSRFIWCNSVSAPFIGCDFSYFMYYVAAKL